MREKFQLWCKIFGSFILISGLFLLIYIIFSFIISQFNPVEINSYKTGFKEIDQLTNSFNVLVMKLLLEYIVMTIFSIAFGLYLLIVDNNIFVKMAYTSESFKSPYNPIEIQPVKQVKKDDDSKWKPPGWNE